MARETVRFIEFYAALYAGLASQALDGGAGAMKPVLWPVDLYAPCNAARI